MSTLACLFLLNTGLPPLKQAFQIDHYKLLCNERIVGLVEVNSVNVKMPLRKIVEGFGMRMKVIRQGQLSVTSSDYDKPVTVAPLPGNKRNPKFVNIYFNGKYSGLGTIEDGQTFIFDFDLDDYGLKWRKDALSESVQIVPKKAQFASSKPGIPFEFIQDRACFVKRTQGQISMIRPTFLDSKFSVEIIVDEGMFKSTTKPITLDFQLVLFNDEGKVVGREKRSIESVASTGGVYVLEGTYGTGEGATSLSLTFVTAWVPRS